MRMISAITTGAALTFAASPAFAQDYGLISLRNTDFVVFLAFLLFIAILFYFKVPTLIGGLLDKRALGIKSDLDEARALRDEAQALLTSYERKQKEVQAQADRIVANARDEATKAAAQAKEDIKSSVARRLTTAREQIESAQAEAVRHVRDQAVTVAIAAARDVIREQMTAAEANKLIDDGIATVEAKLH